MPERTNVAAKPEVKPASENAKPTPTANKSVVQENSNENVPKPLAQTEKKNNLLPTIIVLSIVIGCVAIVTVGKKLT